MRRVFRYLQIDTGPRRLPSACTQAFVNTLSWSDSPKPWPDEFVCKELKAELWRSAKDRARRMAPSVPVFLTEFNDGWPGHN